MGPLRELLAVDQRQALEFFFQALKDVSDPAEDTRELLYNASVLAHYAQISTQSDVDWPAPANLSAVFDHFVADTTLLHDAQMMETAGAQCLLLAGFFEDADAGASQHPLVCGARRELLRPGGGTRAIAFQGTAARHDRQTIRTVAAMPRATEPRASRPAVPRAPPGPTTLS